MAKIKKVSRFNFLYPDIKRVSYVITAEEKVSRHENFAEYVETVVLRCPTKQVFLKILQNSQENTGD